MSKDTLSKNERLTKLLPEDTQKEVNVVGLEDHENTTRIGVGNFTVDFKTLSLAKAKKLIRNGFPFLELKDGKAKNPAPKNIPVKAEKK